MTETRKPRVLLIADNSGTAFWRVKNPLEHLRDMGACDLMWMNTGQLPLRDRFWLDYWDIVVFH